MFNPISLKYLVQHALVFFNSYLFEMEKRMKKVLSSFNSETINS